MITRIAKKDCPGPGAARENGRPDSIQRRHRNSKPEQRWWIVRKSFYGYAMAGLAVALGITWTLGVVGCAPAKSSGYIEASSGAFFPNVRQSPAEVSRLLRNAHYYKLMGRPELALKELEQAHRQAPDNLQIVNNLAQNYEAVGQYEAARKLYEGALSKNSLHPALANNLCFTYYLEGRWQEAETCYRQTLARDPGNEAVRNNLGLLYCRLGRQDEARQLWQEAEGTAAAAYKTRQALAALGRSDGAVYAGTHEPAPTVKETLPPAALAAVAAPSGTANSLQTPAKPLAPQKVAMQLAPSPGSEQPVPDKARPLEGDKPQPAPVKASPASAPAQALQADARPRPAPLTATELEDSTIEIRNGNGVRNLARRTRTLLNQEGFTVAKIGNHIDFGAEQTIIYYRPEGEGVAIALGRTFFPQAKLEPSQDLHKNISVKILLGADLRERRQRLARLVAEGR